MNVQGKVRCELKSDSQVIIKEGYNVISNVAANIALQQSLNSMLGLPCPNPAGMYVTNIPWEIYGSSGFVYDTKKSPYIYLLKGIQDMQSSQKYIPIHASDGSLDQSKITGYAGNARQTSILKEGVIADPEPSYMIDWFGYHRQWLWDKTNANGDIDHIAILPPLDQNPYNGYILWRCISNVNMLDTTNNAIRRGYIVPGFPGITTQNEILLNTKVGTQEKWKYNISTGQWSPVQPGDAAASFPIPQYSLAQLVQNNNLYSIEDYNCKIYNNTGTVVATKSVNFAGHAEVGIFYDGTHVIVSGYDSQDQDNYAAFIKIDPTTFASTNILNKDYTGWGNLPAGWKKNQTIIKGKISDGTTTKWLLWNYQYQSTIICTDIMNIAGTITGCFADCPTAIFVDASNKEWYIKSGLKAPFYQLKESSYTTINFEQQGVWLSQAEYTNWISCRPETLTKNDTQQLKISYKYEFTPV